MNDHETFASYHPEQTSDITEIFHAGASLSRTRILLQELNALNKFPICGQETSQNILTFFHNAEEGFILCLRSHDVNYRKIFHHFQEIRPIAEEDMKEIVQQIGLDWKPEMINRERASNDVAAYRQALTTFSYLSMHRKITFADFPNSPDNLDLGTIELQESYWYRTLTPDVLWELLTKLHEQTEKILYSPQKLNFDKVLPSGHFFSAGMNLSSVLTAES